MKFVYLSLFAVLFMTAINVQADEELCSRDDIQNVCSIVSSARQAMDCYKGAKGYAGISCESACKEKLVYCVENEKVSLKKVFED